VTTAKAYLCGKCLLIARPEGRSSVVDLIELQSPRIKISPLVGLIFLAKQNKFLRLVISLVKSRNGRTNEALNV